MGSQGVTSRAGPPRDPEGRGEPGSAGSPARAREAGAVALGRAAAGAWHRSSREAAAATAPGPASPRQHRSLFTSPVPAALPPACLAHAPPPPPSSLLPPAPSPRLQP